MSALATAFVLLAPVPAHAQASEVDTVRLRPGLVITRATRVLPGTYTLPAPASLDSALVVVRGDDVTVDLTGVTLQGAPPGARLDDGKGVAILVDGGHNVRLRQGRIRGYHVAVLARGTRRLELMGIDASHNWKPRLYSLVEHESLVDWLSFHHNEQDEWLRFGAAFYLEDVSGGTLRDNTVHQGMNGLLLVRSRDLIVRDNDFSFNSGLGIGLYRATANVIVHNRVDYNVRGYSHGFYRRGQDSADILLYEQSSGNTVAFNSATHGGDGLFLWAGQSTMDSGQGGANDNVFYRNDFSFAPANAMEATFSRNRFIANIAKGSDYGLWGGYSFESLIVSNCFQGNRTGIAIEHGQDNSIVANDFLGDTTAIRLWADSIEPSDWGYPKHRDTRSRGYRIEDNRFLGNRTRLQLAHTADMSTQDNDSTGAVPAECPDRSVPGEFARYIPHLPSDAPSAIPSTPAARMPRSAIVVDEWGPFDWRSPKLWPVDSTHRVPLRLAVLGPRGRWRVVARQGVARLSRLAGSVGDTITVTPRAGSEGRWILTLEYRGEATVSPTGARRAAGAPVRFSYERFEPSTHWDVRFFAWTDSTDPRGDPDRFASLLAAAPLLRATVPRLDYFWYRPTIRELPQSHYALEADATVTLPAGRYTLRTISDDGIRVWVDGTLVIDRWTLHESAVDNAPLAAGRHALRVQYFQVDGWSELRLDIVRGIERSTGSSGPH